MEWFVEDVLKFRILYRMWTYKAAVSGNLKKITFITKELEGTSEFQEMLYGQIYMEEIWLRIYPLKVICDMLYVDEKIFLNFHAHYRMDKISAYYEKQK